MENTSERSSAKAKFSFAMFLVAIGIVYGDIGTFPMYVMKSILEGNGGIGQINEDFIIGALSLTIWTITLLTTIKHVLIAMKADNHGEGGIFALYNLVKRCGKWLIIPTMIGGSTMLADGVLTPAVTVTTAVEGLRSIDLMDRVLGEGQNLVILITAIIISVLFMIQRSGTSFIGRIFGPVMLLWFTFLGVTGILFTLGDLSILRCFNPIYAVKILFSPYNKAGFMILGSVFLCTTGAEALYTDMGHVGKENIYFSWPFVKVCLILNYIGQGVWILKNQGNPDLLGIEDLNPFYMMLPEALRPFAVVLSAAAAIIASQALISGSYTLVSEAASLDLMPHLQVNYPSDTKGQLYIPLVNKILWVSCLLVVFYFRSGARMENAYGLAITISMLMMTILLTVYIGAVHKNKLGALLFAIVFGALETVFFISSLGKFTKGGYVAVLLSILLFFLMVVWYRGTEIEQSQKILLKMRDYIDNINSLRQDTEIPKRAENIVFLTNGRDPEYADRDVLYSILDKDPKRADAYWFLTVQVTDEPYDTSYSVETFGTDYIFSVCLRLGYKVDQCVNRYLRQIVTDLMTSGELPEQEKKHSIYGPGKVGAFKFCMVRKTLFQDTGLSYLDNLILGIKYAVRRVAGNPIQWYGLETASTIIEYVPLFINSNKKTAHLERR